VILHDPARHEALQPIRWDESRVREAITRIVRDTEQQVQHDGVWRVHPRDLEAGDDPDRPATNLHYGAAGVIWALQHLQSLGAVTLTHNHVGDDADIERLLQRNRANLQAGGSSDVASYMQGDVPILMLAYGQRPTAALADRLAALIAGNMNHPARELMWGAPGTLLAALFLHRHTGDERWAGLFRETAATLWSQLEWSARHACHYWSQDLFARRSTYLDGVHGFVATASPLIQGRLLLDAAAWSAWQDCIANTVERTATWEGDRANWRDLLDMPAGYAWKRLMQFCHGAPGFVVCLGGFPGTRLDPLLRAAGEAVWAAGPLTKGSSLCHGTGGNGYAFLKLHQRSGDTMWLERARAFAMHGIAQTEAESARHGFRRHSLWTGDIGLAIYLWHCLHGTADFPTLDVFYAWAPAA
jgi:hypothetical protein